MPLNQLVRVPAKQDQENHDLPSVKMHVRHQNIIIKYKQMMPINNIVGRLHK